MLAHSHKAIQHALRPLVLEIDFERFGASLLRRNQVRLIL
jgi:hypothetical protein